MKNRKETTFFSIVLRPLLFGLGASVLLCVLLLSGAAVLLTVGLLPASVATPLALGILTVCAIVGGLVTARLSKAHGLVYGAGCGLLLFLLTALVAIVILQDFEGDLLLVKSLLTVIGGAVGGVLGVNAKRK